MKSKTENELYRGIYTRIDFLKEMDKDAVQLSLTIQKFELEDDRTTLRDIRKMNEDLKQMIQEQIDQLKIYLASAKVEEGIQ